MKKLILLVAMAMTLTFVYAETYTWKVGSAPGYKDKKILSTYREGMKLLSTSTEAMTSMITEIKQETDTTGYVIMSFSVYNTGVFNTKYYININHYYGLNYGIGAYFINPDESYSTSILRFIKIEDNVLIVDITEKASE